MPMNTSGRSDERAATAAHNGDHPAPMPRNGELFPSRLLGFGVFTAWSSLAVSLEIELDIAALSSAIGRLFLLSALTVIAYLVVAAVVHRTGRNLWTRPVLIGCTALGMLFPVLEFAAAFWKLFALDAAAIVCYSAASVGFFLMWAVQISAQPPKTALIAYSGSFALGACIYFLVDALGTAAFFAALLLLPALSCALLHLSSRLPRAEAPEGEDPLRWRIPWRPIVLVAVFTLAFGVVSHFEGNAMMPSELGRLLAGLAALAAALTVFLRLEATAIAKVSGLLAVAALLWCGVQGPEGAWGAGKLLISVGYYGFMLFVLCTLSDICFSYHARPEWLFGIVQAAAIALTAPSGQFGNELRGAFLSGHIQLADAVLAGLVLAIVAACLFLLSENPFSATWGIKAFRTPEGNAAAEPVVVRDYLQDRMYRCALIARQHGLTHREEEVLALLAEGKSFAEIEAALVIAHGTLRAHVQHLYEKLGVHSKQEAVDFVTHWES